MGNITYLNGYNLQPNTNNKANVVKIVFNDDFKNANADTFQNFKITSGELNAFYQDEKFHEDVQNNFECLLDSMGGGMFDLANKLLSYSMDMSIYTDLSLNKIWVSPVKQRYNLNIKFVANQDPINEVFLPSLFLQYITSPTATLDHDNVRTLITDFIANCPILKDVPGVNTFLRNYAARMWEHPVWLLFQGNPIGAPPGGKLTSQTANFAKIYVGKHIILADCIIENARCKYDLSEYWIDPVSKRSYPLSADVSMDLLPKRVLKQDDFEAMIDGTYPLDPDATNTRPSVTTIFGGGDVGEGGGGGGGGGL